jgi:multiple sugar transport system permease protein
MITSIFNSDTPRTVINRLAIYTLAAALFGMLLLPIYWLVVTSFKPLEDVFVAPPQFFPERVTLDNYLAQSDPRLLRFFINSLIVSAASAILSTFAGALCAYAISRFDFRGKNALLLFFLAALAFPVPLLMITMYGTFLKLGLLDTYWALILGTTATGLPLSVWLITNFMNQIPTDMEEAALLDGASPFKVLIEIVLPMIRPGLAASGIFVFVTSWNELIMGLTFVSSPELRTLPAGITLTFLGEFEGDWSEMMALAVLVTVPVFILFAVTQKAVLKGMTAGALK